MGSNSFGKHFRITTWGESHGPAVGVVIDGCPAGLSLSVEDIQEEVDLRRGGQSPYTTPRKESDQVQIYSGIFEGKTTGAPISILFFHDDVDSSKYDSMKKLFRPGHANYTYIQKYGIFDDRGGGRASARETVCRVAAGAVAKKLLKKFEIQVYAYIKQIGSVNINNSDQTLEKIKESSIFCPDPQIEKQMIQVLEQTKQEDDSIGGVVGLQVLNVPIGLGDPVYEKLEAQLANAMLSIPASKGFEIGRGFTSSSMKGSQHNDAFTVFREKIQTKTNHAGGTLGGITTGMPLFANIAFKPTSSIQKKQQTIDCEKQIQSFKLPSGSRHDPCVAIRAVPVVQAMARIVIADALLQNRLIRVDSWT